MIFVVVTIRFYKLGQKHEMITLYALYKGINT
jgi:hypothetical protein